MRTVRVALNRHLDVESDLNIDTEVIVEGDEDALERGKETWRFLMTFASGMNEAAEEDV